MCKRLPWVNRDEISVLDFIVSNPDPRLHAEALASLCPTSRQNGAAALRRHTGTEAVALSSLASVRLIRALHGHFPFNTYKSNFQSIYDVASPSSAFRETTKRFPQLRHVICPMMETIGTFIATAQVFHRNYERLF